jgi:Streptomycin adenylyltransferase
MNAERIIQTIVDWAKAQPTIQAAAVVGSHARGTARADSDIDLVLITTDPNGIRADTAWVDAIGWNAIGARPMKWEDEDYGGVWSRRLWLEQDRGEVEISFGLPSWADVNPLDPGTREVIADGCRILYDPNGLLRRLCAVVAREPRP